MIKKKKFKLLLTLLLLSQCFETKVCRKSWMEIVSVQYNTQLDWTATSDVFLWGGCIIGQNTLFCTKFPFRLIFVMIIKLRLLENLKNMCRYIACIIGVKSLPKVVFLLTWDTTFCRWDTAIRAIRSYWHRALGDLGKRILAGRVGWWETVINPRLGQMLLLGGCHDWGAHTCNTVSCYKLVSEDSPLQYCIIGSICNTCNTFNTAVLANWWCQDWGFVHPCWPPWYT